MDFDILPPVLYQDIWLNIFYIAVAAVVLYIIIVLIATKRRKAKKEQPIDIYSQEYREILRNKHMSSIEILRKETLDGDLSVSELNQKLGVILRSFAAEYSGLNTRPMTLSELKRNKVPLTLVTAIEGFYPIAFKNLSEKADPNISVQAALDVVYQWN